MLRVHRTCPPSRPSRAANTARNLQAESERGQRWKPVRDAFWELIKPYVAAGERVAVVGAGNAHDVPLTRLAAGALDVTLIDIDPRAPRRAVRREPRALRRNLEVITHDVTGGAADAILATAGHTGAMQAALASVDVLPGGPYDLVIGDLLYTQLLYPALLDLGVPPAARAALLDDYGSQLTRIVVECLHRSANKHVVHVHDLLGWWPGHQQPFTLSASLDRRGSPGFAGWLRGGSGPWESDPCHAMKDMGATAAVTAYWRWPFSPSVNYLVRGAVAATRDGPPAGC